MVSTVPDLEPKSAAYLPAVFREAATRHDDPVHALLRIFENDLFRAEQMAADSGLLFDPDELGLLFDPSDVDASPIAGPRAKGKRTKRDLRRVGPPTGRGPGSWERSATTLRGSLQPPGWELDFLRWLASCLLLELDEEWLHEPKRSEQGGLSGPGAEPQTSRYAKARRLIKNVAALYRQRGTPQGLERVIKHYHDWDVEVLEHAGPGGVRVGVDCTIGVNSWLVEPPNLETQFTVLVTASSSNLLRLTGVRSPINLRLATARAERDIWFLGPLAAGDSYLLTAGEVKDWRALVGKLRRHTDRVSEYLWLRFNRSTQEILADPDPASPRVQSALLAELNNLLQAQAFYDSSRFPLEMLSTETRALLAQKLDGERLLRLNRLLLSDAYPGEIAFDQEDGLTAAPDRTSGDPGPPHKSFAGILGRLRALIEREKPAHTSFFLALEVAQREAVVAPYPWLRIEMAGDPKESLFSEDQIKDAPGLVQKLVQHSDRVSRFLWDQFSQEGRRILEHGSGSEKKRTLVAELNNLLAGEALYERERFAEARLSRETEALQSEDLRGSDLVRLHRLLLEDAYPNEIAKSPKTPSSIVGRFWLK